VIPAGIESGSGDWLVRPAQPADWAAACAIIAVGAFDIPPLLATETTFGEAIASGGIYVATAAESVIGILGAQPIAYDGEKPYTLWVEVVAVHPAWRRLGIGTALYHALGQWAEQLNIQGVLTARSGNPTAEALHQHVGFVIHRDDLLLWRFDHETT